MVVVQFQETMRKDEEFEEQLMPYLSLEMVQVVQPSVDHLQVAQERISYNKHLALSQKEMLAVSKRREGQLKKLEHYEAELQKMRAESAKLREKFKVRIKEVPQPGMLASACDTCDMFFSSTT